MRGRSGRECASAPTTFASSVPPPRPSPASGEGDLLLLLPSPGEAQAEDRPQGSPDFPARDFPGTGDAVLEADRHLDDRVAEPPGPVDHLDLERVGLRHDLFE